MVDSVTAPQSTGSTTDSGALGRARLAENFDTFLSLLTTQLKNQDPLSPLDSNQFTQQLVQMTGVEQQLLTNDLLKKLVGNTASGVATAVSLIGKEVRAVSADAQLSNGKADWVYNLDRAASDVKLEILDSQGRIVKAIAPTDNKVGEHPLTWDGKGTAGSTLPDGTYTLRVTAKDSQGTAVTSAIYADGVVTGVEQVDGQTLLTINGAKVPWDKILTIRQPAATVPSSTTAGSTNNPGGTTPSQAAA
jgi:flagellar basal-body rod modification protein FlgD